MLSNRTTSLTAVITDLFLGKVSLPDPSSEVGMDGSSSSAVAVNDGRPRFRVTVGASLFSCTSASLMIAVNSTRYNYSRFGWCFCSSYVDDNNQLSSALTRICGCTTLDSYGQPCI